MNFKESLIDNNSVLLQATAADWRDAIRLGTDMLVASGAVTPDYPKAIIRSIEEHGPYVVIAPQFAMPHARPEDGVNRTAFALVTLASPVVFDGENAPVDVLITLAGSTSDEHMQGLMQVTQVLDDPASDTGINLDKLRQCRTKEDVWRVIDAAISANMA
ncbi:PTS sugar transporter subunit IIA [Martelella alba]|uniref:Ascorbate-specific PTS system EIIA component n=1 Tax=Martelella alba TaxID=2590451 RepID=A0ABY2SRM8_9HYPH|nr:PTS sugar transporter subunit IIA [Martelella alba]TKI08514.1 PTS ascorbate-specific transporter subunit IIA [Martelella alba]